MNNWLHILEFDTILDRAAAHAETSRAAQRIRELEPLLSESECRFRQQETTDARNILDAAGTPPLSDTAALENALSMAQKGAALTVEQLESVVQFINACRRMRQYLRRAAEAVPCALAEYGAVFGDTDELYAAIDNAIRDGRVDDQASPWLRDVRRRIAVTEDNLRLKLESLLRSKKLWFSESYVSQRNGCMTLPVRKEYRNVFPGRVVDVSSSGSTCFMEPHAAAALREELQGLQLAEENEVLRILYALSAMVSDHVPILTLHRENMETLDYAFAKGKFSAELRASEAQITTERRIVIRGGRHPLLDADQCVPLDFAVGDGRVRGIVITGPNTGGKTVALKTVGLLSAMAQSGLHVPAGEGSLFTMHDLYLADIGDGQSIAENLSTFSAHIRSIVRILGALSRESLVLLDELGSGTDPAEGMGIATAILDELCRMGCLFVATTHYPEIKDFARDTEGLCNARMAFDRESLRPLYRLEIGEAGESCALYIAKGLGFPGHLIERAFHAAYSRRTHGPDVPPMLPDELKSSEPGTRRSSHAPGIRKAEVPASDRPLHRDIFQMGDSVIVYPKRIRGIVYRPCDDRGNVTVQIRGKKQEINHKRLKLEHSAAELYPEGYDFSVIFDSVANRKARHQMEKHHIPGLVVTEEPEDIN